MPNYTKNLQLVKPLQSEQYNVDVFNANADKIDQFAGQTPARALTADKLTTGAKINGVNFKGDTDIITGLGLHNTTVTYSQSNLAYKVVDDEVVVKRCLNNDTVGDNFDDDTYWEEVQLGGGASRNIGEIIPSALPLTDAGLHLLDGALINGSGIYSAFVDYIAQLYTDNPNASYFCQGESLQPWSQPILTSNGTMGGDSYACDSSSIESGHDTWRAFDNDTSDVWGSSSIDLPDWITFYSPVYLRLSNVYLHFGNSSEIYSAGEIQGSNDNSVWTTLTSFSSNSSLEINLPISTNISYKYIRFYGTSVVSGGGWGKIAKFQITAQQGQEVTAEQEWQTSVTTYGVCGKFVYDSTNNTVRLPKVTGKIDGTTDINALGDLEPLFVKLPNITGYVGAPQQGNQANGAFYSGSEKPNTAGGSYKHYMVYMDASRSSSVYSGNGTDTTIHEQAINMLYYIVIATSTKTDIQVDIDEIATDLNGKADVDLSNCTKPHIVETYVNGTSWYRVYSDGWCEQGGRLSVSSNQTVTINFLKPFVDTNYIAFKNLGIKSTGNSNAQELSCFNFTTTTMQTQVNTDHSYSCWQACGYIE